MKRYQKILLIIIVLLIGSGAAAFFVWKRGTPYQSPFWSPNGQYYVQKYQNLTLSNFISVGPGNGSDMIDGYIRVFDKNGNCLHERFAIFIRDVEPVWSGNKLYLMGIAEMDDDPWILPTSAE